jgi:DNA-binding transcriptional LysR family regulator
MPGTVDLNQLPLFVAVADAASMSEAARRLNLPKSSVSRGISALEESLGVQLFHRTTRQVKLTTAGTSFYEKTAPLVALVRDATHNLPEQTDVPSGTLRLTAPPDLGFTLLPELLAKFCARYPEVQLDVRLSNRLEDLVGEGFDVALRISPRLKDSTLVARKLSGLDLRLYAAPSYLAKRGVPKSLEELGEHDFVVFRTLATALPVKLKAVVQTDDVFFTHQATLAGLGIGAMASFLAKADVESGALVPVLPRWSKEVGSLFFVHPKTQHTPRKVTALRDFIIEHLRNHPLCPEPV